MLGTVARPLRSAGLNSAVYTAIRAQSRNISSIRVLDEQPNDQRPSQSPSHPRTAILPERSIRRQFSASAPRFRDHHFDTLKFVQRLKEEGFTEEQAVAMMKVLSNVIEERFIILDPFIPLL